MAFIRTTAINKILALTKFVHGIQGGTSAGKTFGVLPVLINTATVQPLIDISVVAESVPHLKRGAMKDFKKIMKETGRWVDERWNATDFKYTYANGSAIEFFSADVDSKLRGARRDYLYMNEANNMSFHVYTELAARTSKGIYLDWNPTTNYWFNEELANDANVDYIVLTYKDNEACPEAARNFILNALRKGFHKPTGNVVSDDRNIKNSFWANWYRVYGLGIMGSLQGVVYNNWTQVNELPVDEDGNILAEFVAHGLDFGFVKPAAMLDVYLYEGDLYIDERLYETQLSNAALVERFKALGVSKHDVIIADSAEPKSIADLSNAGYTVEKAQKGGDSIRAGIKILQQYKIYVTARSLNLIKELRAYKWATNRKGDVLEVPAKFMDHLLDAMRYVALNMLSMYAEGSGEYSFSGDEDPER